VQDVHLSGARVHFFWATPLSDGAEVAEPFYLASGISDRCGSHPHDDRPEALRARGSPLTPRLVLPTGRAVPEDPFEAAKNRPAPLPSVPPNPMAGLQLSGRIAFPSGVRSCSLWMRGHRCLARNRGRER
jgi:hypothetical protein